jgi:hypothetical protein
MCTGRVTYPYQWGNYSVNKYNKAGFLNVEIKNNKNQYLYYSDD